MILISDTLLIWPKRLRSNGLSKVMKVLSQTINLDSHMFQKIFIDQNVDLESDASLEEIKKAHDVVNAVKEFFSSSKFPPGNLVNSTYAFCYALILISDVQTAIISKADFEKAFDSVRWILFRGVNTWFGVKWRGWIQACLSLAMGSILVNESPSSEFKFHKVINVIPSLLMRMMMLSLVWDKAIVIHIVNMRNCFYLGLAQINIQKSKIMGIGTSQEKVDVAANVIGCNTFSSPFNYLGVKVGSSSSRSNFWDEMESIHRRFFNGADINENKMSMIGWEKIMVAGKNGGLGIGYYAVFGDGGALDNTGKFARSSTWTTIVRECGNLSSKDDHLLLAVGAPIRWVLEVPIKINITAWKVSLDKLPTRLNLSLQGIEIPSITCPICSCAGESCSHLFFSCFMARKITTKLARWWEFDCPDLFSYDDWLEWFHTLRLLKGFKDILEGVFYVMWWVIWKYRNQTLFGSSQPRMDMLFDEIVLLSFTWCSNRCKNNFDWISWMKCPRSLSL
ncbi:RNA-directed DNA polymerase, eukaryota [Tanacetum coccineum]